MYRIHNFEHYHTPALMSYEFAIIVELYNCTWIVYNVQCYIDTVEFLQELINLQFVQERFFRSEINLLRPCVQVLMPL